MPPPRAAAGQRSCSSRLVASHLGHRRPIQVARGSARRTDHQRECSPNPVTNLSWESALACATILRLEAVALALCASRRAPRPTTRELLLRTPAKASVCGASGGATAPGPRRSRAERRRRRSLPGARAGAMRSPPRGEEQVRGHTRVETRFRPRASITLTTSWLVCPEATGRHVRARLQQVRDSSSGLTLARDPLLRVRERRSGGRVRRSIARRCRGAPAIGEGSTQSASGAGRVRIGPIA